MTMFDENKIKEQKNEDKYESKFGETSSGNIRGLAIFETYKTKFYLNKINEIIGFDFNDKILGDYSDNVITELGFGNVIKSIIEQKKYENIEEFIKEINVVYSFKLSKILLNKEEFQKKYYNFGQ